MNNIKYMKKAELLELAKEGGIEIPEGATNPEIRKLLTSPPKKVKPPKVAESEPIVEEAPTELEILQERLAELEATWQGDSSVKGKKKAKQQMEKIRARIALLN